MFPNYSSKEECYQTWTRKLKNQRVFAGKPCFSEIKGDDKYEFTAQNFKSSVDLHGSAILFCVCRGRFTEGYNFKKHYCRGIIFAGVPNLNIKEPKMIMKKLFYSKFPNLFNF